VGGGDDRQVYDLGPEDLAAHPVWWFPMDDTVTDEATVRPLAPGDPPAEDHRMIVATAFRTAVGVRFQGYVYVTIDDRVESRMPVR